MTSKSASELALRDQIDGQWRLFDLLVRRTLANIWAAGKALAKIRDVSADGLRRGLDDRGISRSTGYRWIQVAEHYSTPEELQEMGSLRRALAAIVHVDESDVEEAADPTSDVHDRDVIIPHVIDAEPPAPDGDVGDVVHPVAKRHRLTDIEAEAAAMPDPETDAPDDDVADVVHLHEPVAPDDDVADVVHLYEPVAPDGDVADVVHLHEPVAKRHRLTDIEAEALPRVPRGCSSHRHPARFRPHHLVVAGELLAELLPGPVAGEAVRVLDPMCGTGWELHDWATNPFRSAERPPIVDLSLFDVTEWADRVSYVQRGDARDLPLAADTVDAVVTSPPWGNRMADAMSTDGDQRVTYSDRRGSPADAHDISGMQWGEKYREHIGAVVAELDRVCTPRAPIIWNIADHYRAGKLQQVTGWTVDMFGGLGWHIAALRTLPAKGVGGVQHQGSRAGIELMLGFLRS